MEDRLKQQRLQQRAVLAARDARMEQAAKWERARKPVPMPVITGSPPPKREVLIARALAALRAKQQNEEAAARQKERQATVINKARELEARNRAREIAMMVRVFLCECTEGVIREGSLPVFDEFPAKRHF
jgi:hypothetical protein